MRRIADFSLKLLIVWIALGGLPCQAHEVLDNYDRFLESLQDSPKALMKETASRLDNLNPEQNPAGWVKAYIAHVEATGAADEDMDAIENLDSNLAKVRQLAEELELHDYVVRTMDIIIDRARNSSSPPSDQQLIVLYEEVFAYADRYGVLREKALVMCYYANYLVEMGRGEDSLKALNAALKTLQSDPRHTVFSELIVKGYMAVALWFLGDYDKFLAYMEPIDQFCKDSTLSSYCATQLYNLGLSFVENFQRQDFDRAEGYFQRSIEMAKAIDDDHDVGLCNYGLGTLYLRQKRWKEAEEKLLIGRKIFERLENRVYLVKIMAQMGQVYLGKKQFQAGLHVLDEARAIIQPEMKRDLNRIQEVTYQIYRQSGRKAEALEALEIYLEGFKKISEDLQKREYSKAVTAMGLRIEEEKNKALQAENDRKIKDLQRLTLAAFVLLGMLVLVAASMIIAGRRGRQVRAAKERMQLILDTIDEGILSVATDLTINDEHSPFIQQLFPQQKLAGENIVEAVFRPSSLSPEEVAMSEEALRVCLGEDRIAWEFNAIHLPKELTYGDGRSLALHWMPIISGQTIRKLLLAIRDISEQKELREKLEQQQDKVNRLQRKIGEVLSGKFQDIRRVLERLDHELPSLSVALQDDQKRRDTLRTLHTLKGEARSLGLRDLSQGIHRVEDACRGPAFEELSQSLQNLQEQWQEYQHVVRNVFSLPQNESRDNDQLLDVLGPLASEVRRQSQENGLGFAGLEVLDHVEHWTPEALQTARSVLVHGLANALDHGYLLPRKKQQAISKPWFQIEATEHANLITLKIRDQGVGLNWDILQKLARDRNFHPTGHETIADIVFQDGLSTADDVTETSGRGVGLSAVRAICRQLDGDAHLTSNDRGPGAMLLLQYRKT